MKSSTHLIILLAGMLTIVLASCKPDPVPVPTPTGEFSCFINGKPFKGITFDNTLLVGNSSPGQYAKRVDIRATNATNDTTLYLTFGEEPAPDSTFDCPTVNDTIFQDDWGNTGAFITMKIGNVFNGFPISGYTFLSKCDEQDLLMDGTFDIVSLSLINTSDTIYYTNGVFKDMSYRVVK